METRAKSRRGRWIVVVLVLVILVVGLYWLDRQGTSLWGTLSSFQESSEDAATTAKVRASLALSKRVSGLDIEVTSRDGVVTLRGEVPSSSAKALAETIVADTSGVRQIVNDLTVDPEAVRDPELDRLASRVEELEIRTAVSEALAAEPTLRGAELQVRTEGRKVTLAGAVETLEQKRRAEELAGEVDRVEAVVNDLSARGDGRSSAEASVELAERVEFELFRTRAFSLESIIVKSEAGVVTLEGSVRSRAEQLLAERLAREATGVREVVNRLQVDGG